VLKVKSAAENFVSRAVTTLNNVVLASFAVTTNVLLDVQATLSVCLDSSVIKRRTLVFQETSNVLPIPTVEWVWFAMTECANSVVREILIAPTRPFVSLDYAKLDASLTQTVLTECYVIPEIPTSALWVVVPELTAQLMFLTIVLLEFANLVVQSTLTVSKAKLVMLPTSVN